MFMPLAIALPLHATPERVLDVKAEIVARNDEAYFVDVTLWDNVGLYTRARADQYVLMVDYQTGQGLAWYPIRSTVTDNEGGYFIQEREVRARYGYSEVLIEAQAGPIWERAGGESPRGYKIKNDALITNFDDPSGDSGALTLLSKEELHAIAMDQIGLLLKQYPELTDEQYADLSGEYLASHRLTGEEECEVSAQYNSHRPDAASAEGAHVPLKISCEFADGRAGWFEYFVFVEPWRALQQKGDDK